jgi:AcrR family transcriptional regulator
VETRARILEVARAHFERDGYDHANVRAIAADAGVAAGTVLLHFADKRDLLHAALFDDLAALIAKTTSATTGRGQPLETRLRELVRPFFAYYAERPMLSKELLREALLADSPWRERFTEQVARVHAHVVALVEEAKARGEVAAETDSVILGASFFAFYYFALIGWVQGGLSAPAPLFDRMLSEHLRGRVVLHKVDAKRGKKTTSRAQKAPRTKEKQ